MYLFIKKFFILFIFYFFLINLEALEFPKDHSFHKGFGIEWCYFVGNLETKDNGEFGYELSFFRAELNGKFEVFPVHFAISDIKNNKHYTAETLQRNLGNLAVYSDSLIRSGDYKIEILGESEFKISANPRNKDIGLEFHLTANKKEILLHGDNGYSIKSNRNKNIYSYYYSIPRLKTKGFLFIGKQKMEISSGTSWMDHEWSFPVSELNPNSKKKQSLASSENSWDWICLNLDDGSDLMLFNFRETKLHLPETFGTLRLSTGEILHFQTTDNIELKPDGIFWKSSKTNKKYPMSWKIQAKDISLEIQTRFPEQEFIGFESTGNSYWEGSISAKGLLKGKQITGKGYLELKGY